MSSNDIKEVLVVTGLYPPEIGGPATYSKLLETELPKHGFTVKILAFKEVRYLPKIIRHVVFIVKIIWRSRTADIIYAQDPLGVGFPTTIACFVLNRSYLLRLGGDYAWEQGVQRFGVNDTLDIFSANNNYGFRVKVFKKIQTTVAKRAEKIIVPSQYLKKIIMNWGISSEKIEVIYSSFKNPHLDETKNELQQVLGFTGRSIISIGRLVPWKGFEVLIDSMPVLLNDRPEVRLYIAGDGPLAETLKTRVNSLKLANSVVFLGTLPQIELFKYLKASDVFVLNTAYEGLSHQILEAMALGTPVVTTAVGGNLELVTDQKSGLLFAYNDKQALIKNVQLLLNDSNLASTISTEALQVIEKFSLANTIPPLVTILNKYARS